MDDKLTPQELHQKKTVAGILALVLGSMGIHYFYIGKPIAGAITIFSTLFTCGLTGLITSLICGIRMLTCSDEEFRTRYLETEKAFPI